MNVTVEYAAQVKRAAGVASEEVELEAGSTLQSLLGRIVDNHGDPLRRLLLDSVGRLHPSILVFVGENQVRWDDQQELKDRDVVTFLSPISGG